MRFLAIAPRGVTELLCAELVGLGIAAPRASGNGAHFEGELDAAYRACVHSRLANRVLLQLPGAPAGDEDGLYAAAQEVHWPDHLDPAASFCVEFSSRGSWLSHERFGAQKVKDAIVDQLRAHTGRRPDVDRRDPAVRVHAHLRRDQLELSIELAREPLFRRKPQGHGGAAPLKENVAAAALLRAGWPELCASGAPLLDPMCGSGTLLVEGALIAAGVAPGLMRASGPSAWRGHDLGLWAACIAVARANVESVPGTRIIGYDHDEGAVARARASLNEAGLDIDFQVERQDLERLRAPAGAAGLVITNPPYGARSSPARGQDLAGLYRTLGERLKHSFGGWRSAVLCAESAPHPELRLTRARRYRLYNGAIPCVVLRAEIFSPGRERTKPGAQSTPALPDPAGERTLPGAPPAPALVAPGCDAALRRAEAFANRLRKNMRHLGKWARRRAITCYRLYDADLPEYALAIDLYGGEKTLVHAQEYAPPLDVPAAKASQRFEDALAVLAEVLEVPAANIVAKRRQRQRGASQYRRQAVTNRFHPVREGEACLLVNLHDFLDTGLFLDHRPMRRRIAAQAAGKRFLNLYAYTASATVAAVLGGASRSVSVDASRTYTEWSRKNLDLNRADPERHEVVQADCREWLATAASGAARFDLIFLDPPTFSNSRSLRQDLDVQRDHVELIRAAARVLAPDGVILFSTNKRRFRLDAASLGDQFQIEDISRSSLDEDFVRRPQVHACFSLGQKAPTVGRRD